MRTNMDRTDSKISSAKVPGSLNRHKGPIRTCQKLVSCACGVAELVGSRDRAARSQGTCACTSAPSRAHCSAPHTLRHQSVYAPIEPKCNNTSRIHYLLIQVSADLAF